VAQVLASAEGAIPPAQARQGRKKTCLVMNESIDGCKRKGKLGRGFEKAEIDRSEQQGSLAVQIYRVRRVVIASPWLSQTTEPWV